jgi:hypothetical protein
MKELVGLESLVLRDTPLLAALSDEERASLPFLNE